VQEVIFNQKINFKEDDSATIKLDSFQKNNISTKQTSVQDSSKQEWEEFFGNLTKYEKQKLAALVEINHEKEINSIHNEFIARLKPIREALSSKY
jgi:hypothetical protein